jgi:DNA-directed RNA polymerase III subunit RPC2
MEYLAKKLRVSKSVLSGRKTSLEEVQDVLNRILLSHVELAKSNRPVMIFMAKLRYFALMIRRIIDTIYDPTKLDDKDYYGNKRLELAGQLISLLFEDLFKKFQSDLKKQVDRELGKQSNKKEAFDAIACFDTNSITHGLVAAMKSGNWNIERFKMDRSSITAELTRLSYISAIGMMTRINS